MELTKGKQIIRLGDLVTVTRGLYKGTHGIVTGLADFNGKKQVQIRTESRIEEHILGGLVFSIYSIKLGKK